MSMQRRVPLFILLLLNVVVLLGQLWPEGAPPFARAVNIVFLAANLLFLAVFVRARGAGR